MAIACASTSPTAVDWFPYFMRRLAERPANVAFFARNFLRFRGKDSEFRYSFLQTVTPSRSGINTENKSFDSAPSGLFLHPAGSSSSAAAFRAAFPDHKVLSVINKPPRRNLGSATRAACRILTLVKCR